MHTYGCIYIYRMYVQYYLRDVGLPNLIGRQQALENRIR